MTRCNLGGVREKKRKEKRPLFSIFVEGTSLIARATTTDVAGHERNEIVAKTQDKVEGEEEDMIERSTTDPFSLWWSLLLGLSTRVADARLQVRLRALETLQNVFVSILQHHLYS